MINRDSPNRSGQGQLKTFWKGVTILDATKNICESWEQVKVTTFTGVCKKLIPILLDDFERFKTSAEEVTADVVEIIRELVLGLESEGVNC